MAQEVVIRSRASLDWEVKVIGEKLEVDRFHESLLPYHNSLSEHLVSIFKLSVGLVFNVAFYALLPIMPACSRSATEDSSKKDSRCGTEFS